MVRVENQEGLLVALPCRRRLILRQVRPRSRRSRSGALDPEKTWGRALIAVQQFPEPRDPASTEGRRQHYNITVTEIMDAAIANALKKYVGPTS